MWLSKIERNYNSKLLIWRGLANRTHEFSDAELVDMFKFFNSHLLSNRIVKQSNQNQGQIRSLILNDFETYNKEVLSGNYISMVTDHTTTGPKYAQSYGLSTSKKEVVGKAFAMGAMVIANYGQHNTHELQKTLKSRITLLHLKQIKI